MVSNSDMEEFGIPYFKHSNTMFLPEDLLRMLYIALSLGVMASNEVLTVISIIIGQQKKAVHY